MNQTTNSITKILENIKQVLSPNGKVDLIEYLKKEAFVVNSKVGGGTINFDLTPWWKEPFIEMLENPTLKEINLCAPIGSGKTTYFLAMIYISLLLQARQTLIVGINEQLTTDIFNLYIKPSLRLNKKLKAIWPKRKTDLKLVMSWPHMDIYLGYATAMRTLQQRSCDFVACDEAWTYPSETFDYARSRLHARDGARILFCSQAGDLNGPWDENCKKGLTKHYAWCCPNCKEQNIYKFDYLKFEYEKDEMEKPIYTTVKAWMECPKCQHTIEDNIQNRRSLSENASYIVDPDVIQNHIPDRYTFKLNQLCMYKITWAEIAIDFLQANNSNIKTIALKNFFQQKLAEMWDTAYFQDDYDITKVEDGYAMDEYKNDTSWKYRFLVADVQKSQIWLIVRDFDEYGNSRLVGFRYASHINDIETIRKEYNVNPKFVAVDMAYREAEVKTACCLYGWKGYNGQADRTYTIIEKGKKVVQYFSDPKNHTIKTPTGIKGCQCFHYAGTTVKDILNLSLIPSGNWKIPSSGDNLEMYKSQVFGSELREVNNANGKVTYRKVRDDNHAFDCEVACVVMATIFGAFISSDIVEVESEMND